MRIEHDRDHAWNTWNGSCLALISDWDGTPTTPYGAAYQSHLTQLP